MRAYGPLKRGRPGGIVAPWERARLVHTSEREASVRSLTRWPKKGGGQGQATECKDARQR
eukprot:CAMPEP_0198500500 /NCGR_PEP_ID=MMETSP1462-20131121/8195_1 /TAXON_ID=1333877 /ORGANISM="Brandtodinium nutriculum, Strain RCC3387" /LENGTH=59 /DNA_ID=CAMNT_0044229509 /DNA_START=81 /DNA_END=260 /DNA_ORIENTATION=+